MTWIVSVVRCVRWRVATLVRARDLEAFWGVLVSGRMGGEGTDVCHDGGGSAGGRWRWSWTQTAVRSRTSDHVASRKQP